MTVEWPGAKKLKQFDEKQRFWNFLKNNYFLYFKNTIRIDFSALEHRFGLPYTV